MIELSHQLAEIACKVIRERRMALALSQDGLSQRTGLARSYISDVERGSRHPTLHNITLLANALEWTTSQLIHETEMQAVYLLDPERIKLAALGKVELSALETEVVNYVDRRISAGVVLADVNHNFVLFNGQARSRLYGGIREASPEQWPETYGIFQPDRVTPFPPQELTIVNALKGKNTNIDVFIRNPLMNEGGHFHVSGRKIVDPVTGSLRGAFAMLVPRNN
jgi:transcriptional regulator with XRE-family HTH domain